MGETAKPTGLRRVIFNLRYRRHKYRQQLGILLLVLLVVVGDPQQAWLWYLGSLLVAAGEGIRLWASGHVKKDAELATDGPYGYVRHPLYVGNILIVSGFAIACGEPRWALPVAAIFLVLFYPSAVASEDNKLRQLFPGQWEPWAGRTRALLPRLTPYDQGGFGGWSPRQSLMENGEPIYAAVMALGLMVLYARLPA